MKKKQARVGKDPNYHRESLRERRFRWSIRKIFDPLIWDISEAGLDVVTIRELKYPVWTFVHNGERTRDTLEELPK